MVAWQQDAQNLADAIEAALACETGQQWSPMEQRLVQAVRSMSCGRRGVSKRKGKA